MRSLSDHHIHTQKEPSAVITMLDRLYSFGVRDANLLSITYMNYPLESNLLNLFIKDLYHPINLRVFGGLYYHKNYNYTVIPFEEQAKILLSMGCDGIKLIDMKPNYRRFVGFGMDSPLYDKMFNDLEEHQIPVICHANDPDTFWDIAKVSDYCIKAGWYYGDGTCLSYEEIYQEVFNRLERNPGLKMNFAHFFFMSEHPERAAMLLDKYPNIGLDLTPGGEMYPGFASHYEIWQDFFKTYQDRIYYGTDSEPNASEEYLYQLTQTVTQALGPDRGFVPVPHNPNLFMRGLNLSEEIQEKITRSNYFNFVGKMPKPISRDLYRKHAEAILHLCNQRRLIWN